jgi:hypothetical protein
VLRELTHWSLREDLLYILTTLLLFEGDNHLIAIHCLLRNLSFDLLLLASDLSC